jgi:hypothetical protein
LGGQQPWRFDHQTGAVGLGLAFYEICLRHPTTP